MAFPVVAPLGTGTTILVAFQIAGVAATPLNVTVLVPWTAPNEVPKIVTKVPADPDVGVIPVIAGTTVKVIPMLLPPMVDTTTGPVVAPVGTCVVILVALQLLGIEDAPLNVTVLGPCGPKPVPVTVTVVPQDPDAGLRLEMLGTTENERPLLGTPPSVTTTFPVVAVLGTKTVMPVLLQLVGVAIAPLNVTVVEP